MAAFFQISFFFLNTPQTEFSYRLVKVRLGYFFFFFFNYPTTSSVIGYVKVTLLFKLPQNEFIFPCRVPLEFFFILAKVGQ